MPTLEDVQTLCQLMLADEHVMICFCGVDMERDADTRVLQEAIRKIIRIKMKMGRNHQMSVAKAQGSTLVVEQEFTKDVAALVAAVPEALSLAEHNDVVDLDVLLSAAARYFSVQRDVSQQLHVVQSDTPRELLTDPGWHLDVIYWYRDVPFETAQALVLMLSHPAHRLSQNAAEQLLGTWFSPNKKVDFLHQD
ncbi:hypothetical protein PsorP6_013710 [Peronosclerospora sorghi]|uniref:Uncharacterized protein n=1 Tax=Peronosclerospora sorghi TaxID=230839 RepID=A0ACC0VFX7_9STRA|nr:hypothetical protein PsorP6_013710 [Peronosclerospora sorghi]